MFYFMLSRLKTILSHPLVRGLDLDSLEANSLRKRIIQEKLFLKEIYKEWYTEISISLPKTPDGPVLEIGSGGGFLKEFVPGLITSEILNISSADILLDGHCLPFKKNSLKGIVMIDVFHHMQNVKLFLDSAAYCLKSDGVLVMVEPWNTAWSRFVYTYLHHESFDHEANQWNFTKGGPLSQANSALPWIVFSRDKEKFEQEFSTWHIHKIRSHTPFQYLISGGVSFISFSPMFLYKMWRGIEDVFNPWMNLWAMFATIILVNNRE